MIFTRGTMSAINLVENNCARTICKSGDEIVISVTNNCINLLLSNKKHT
ncbi:aminotransferase class V-fold PLP-dependent enzyme [Aneurinibacillus migulanus]